MCVYGGVCVCVWVGVFMGMDKRKTRGHIDLTKEDEHLLILVLTLSRKVEKKTKSSCNSVLT